MEREREKKEKDKRDRQTYKLTEREIEVNILD